MTRFAVPLLLLTALATTGATQHLDRYEQAKFDTTLAGLKPGAPQHCIRRDRVTELLPFGDTILFREGRGKLWRNDLASRCMGLQRGDRAIVESAGMRYCGGDPVRSRNPVGGAITGMCRLGDFVPYSK